ncbi:MAG: M48 family metallopeptidase [Saprospiraceae bacterium]|nr:M48 family metallopeptidase [Saprospiraceae bacterium]
MADFISVNDVEIPLRIKRRWKNGIRYSISKKQINLTIPAFFSSKMQKSEIEKLRSWILEKVQDDKKILDRFRTRLYRTGESIEIRGHTFVLSLSESDRKTMSGKIDGDIILINAPNTLTPQKRGSMIERLLSRLLSAYFLPEIEERVYYFNSLYFNENIGRVRMKYNVSNWGSCSSKKNINLSSRLLMAPQDIVDYVIIHELAHLREMNHSPEFWSIVKKIMPGYRQKELWVKENGAKLKF